jgi:hypothetical protein
MHINTHALKYEQMVKFCDNFILSHLYMIKATNKSEDNGYLKLTKVSRGEKSEIAIRVVDIDQLGETGSLTFIRMEDGTYHYVSESLNDIAAKVEELLLN